MSEFKSWNHTGDDERNLSSLGVTLEFLIEDTSIVQETVSIEIVEGNFKLKNGFLSKSNDYSTKQSNTRKLNEQILQRLQESSREDRAKKREL